MNRLKKLTILLLSSILLTGCNSQSLAEYNEKQQEVSKETQQAQTINQDESKETDTKQQSRIKSCKYNAWELKSDARIVEMQDTGNIICQNTGSIDIQVLDATVTDSVYDLEKFSGYDESEFYDKLKKVADREAGLNNELQKDGTFKCSIDGIENTCMFIKLKLINRSNEKVSVPIGQLGIVSMSEDKSYSESICIPDDALFDKLMYTDANCLFYEFEPYEELETVFIYVHQKEKIVSVEESVDSNGKYSFTVADTQVIDYNNLYMRTNLLGAMKSVDGECYMKLIFNDGGIENESNVKN